MHFGELAILRKEDRKDLGTRSANCTAVEQSNLLAVSKIYYRKMLNKDLNNDIDNKISFLKNLPFFQDVSPDMLITLVSNLEK